MNLRLPPHIAWPLFVVALLSLSVAAAVVTVLAARSDGGAQVVDDYYQKAARWEETMAEQAASDALGWDATVSVVQASGGTRAVELTILDADGAPVEGLTGILRALRPHRTGAVAEGPLSAVADAPGVYRQDLPIHDTGLWDFEIIAVRDGARFQTTIRKEVTR